MKSRRLDVAQGDERYELLLEIGEIFATKLNDRTRAAKTYIVGARRAPRRPQHPHQADAALQRGEGLGQARRGRAQARRLRRRQEAEGQVPAHRGHGERAAARRGRHRARLLRARPRARSRTIKALEEAIELRTQKGDYDGVETLLKLKLDHANEANDQRQDARRRSTSSASSTRRTSAGSARPSTPTRPRRRSTPRTSSATRCSRASTRSDPEQYLDKAVNAHRAILRRNPDRAESYKLLRKLYTEAKRADAAWCLCQALFLMNLAEPDEERFFRRMRADTPAAARAPADRRRLAEHCSCTKTPTRSSSAIFALIEPAIIGAQRAAARGAGLRSALRHRPRSAARIPMAQTHLLRGQRARHAGCRPPSRTPTTRAGSRSCTRTRRPSSSGRSALEAQIAAAGGGVHRRRGTSPTTGRASTCGTSSPPAPASRPGSSRRSS